LKLFIFIIFCSITTLLAQEISFHNQTVKNGLPENHVKSIIQDKNGFIWFGTQNCLARYAMDQLIAIGKIVGSRL